METFSIRTVLYDKISEYMHYQIFYRFLDFLVIGLFISSILRFSYRDFSSIFETSDLIIAVIVIVIFILITFYIFLTLNSDEVIDGDQKYEKKHGILYH